MFIQTLYKKTKNKTYKSVLLMESYRDGGGPKHRILSNLSKLPPEVVSQIGDAIKRKTTTRLDDFNYTQGKSCGGLIVAQEIAKRLGICQALGKSREGKLALLQVIGRIFTQGSRLHLAKGWQKDHAVKEVLGISHFDEDDLYENLDWLTENQLQIEQSIFQHRHIGESLPEIYLYDVTSTYLEGTENELAEYGYNRDGKRGKKQIVIGLLCDKEGYPVSIEVFEGNTNDTKTVINQLKKLKELFGVERVIFVGDKGMLKAEQIEAIISDEFKWNYITSITKPQIESLLTQNIIQLSMFDENLTEVITNQVRYILRRNPARALEITKNRLSKIEKVKQKITLKNNYLKEHKRARPQTAQKHIINLIKKLKADKFLTCPINQRELSVEISQSGMEEISKLDGCYVIKTDVSNSIADKKIIHDRYKDLAMVESAFRTIKTTLEEIRPVYVRKENRTRGHVLVCMLAYMMIKYIADQTKTLKQTRKDILSTLDAIHYIKYMVGKVEIKTLPSSYHEHQNQILERLKIKLPTHL